MQSHLSLALVLCGLMGSATAQTFQAGQDISTSVNGAFGVATGDLNGDGWEDIVSVGRLADGVYWQANNADGTFSSLNIIDFSADDVRNATCADFDGDGDIDVAASVFGEDEHVWYANDGSGNFGPPQRITGSNGCIDLIAEDLDGDSDMDLAAVDLNSNRIWIAWNDGTGTFSDTALSGAQFAPRGLDAADINGDGFLDLVVASRNDSEVQWYANSGAGSFGTANLIGTISEAFSVSCADFNGDGTQDVVTASNNANQVVWWANLGGGLFGAQQSIVTGLVDAVDGITGDFNNDGSIDVIAVGRGQDRLDFFANDGSGSFTFVENLTTSADGAIDAKTVDLNNDGFLDVVSASEFDDAVAIYLNGTGLISPCPTPTAPLAAPTATSVTVSWTGDSSHLGYLVQGRPVGGSAFVPAITLDTFRSVFGLFPGITYEWKVTARCTDGSTSDATDLQTFSTPALREEAHIEPILARSGEAQFHLQHVPEQSTVRIVDLNGRLMASHNSPNGYLAIDASAWTPGLYVLEWTSPEGETGTLKLQR